MVGVSWFAQDLHSALYWGSQLSLTPAAGNLMMSSALHAPEAMCTNPQKDTLMYT